VTSAQISATGSRRLESGSGLLVGSPGAVPLPFERLGFALCGREGSPRLAQPRFEPSELVGRRGGILLCPRDHGIRSFAGATQLRVAVVDRPGPGPLGDASLRCTGARLGGGHSLGEIDGFEADRLERSQQSAGADGVGGLRVGEAGVERRGGRVDGRRRHSVPGVEGEPRPVAGEGGDESASLLREPSDLGAVEGVLSGSQVDPQRQEVLELVAPLPREQVDHPGCGGRACAAP
jgi:hypothetical protein